MNLELSAEALEFGRQVHRALESAGGDALVQEAEREPARRAVTVPAILGELGSWHLEPHRSPDEMEAAAALCRASGWWAVSYPVAERLSRPRDLDADGLLVVDPAGAAAPVAGLGLRWVAVALDGRRSEVVPRPPRAGPRKTAFVCDLDLRPIDETGAADVALALVLPCWTLLGMLDRAMQLTRSYILEREQFGAALASFQGVQFQLTDAEVERLGVEELAKYALWSVEAGSAEVLHDALALRSAVIEAADVVFRVCHQLHGAIGFCDETTLSWLSRYSVPLRRLPFGLSATRHELTRLLGRQGLAGIFGPGGNS